VTAGRCRREASRNLGGLGGRANGVPPCPAAVGESAAAGWQNGRTCGAFAADLSRGGPSQSGLWHARPALVVCRRL